MYFLKALSYKVIWYENNYKKSIMDEEKIRFIVIEYLKEVELENNLIKLFRSYVIQHKYKLQYTKGEYA